MSSLIWQGIFLEMRKAAITDNAVTASEKMGLISHIPFNPDSSDPVGDSLNALFSRSDLIGQKFGRVNILSKDEIDLLKKNDINMQAAYLEPMRANLKNWLLMHPESSLSVGALDADIENVNPVLGAVLSAGDISANVRMEDYNRLNAFLNNPIWQDAKSKLKIMDFIKDPSKNSFQIFSNLQKQDIDSLEILSANHFLHTQEAYDPSDDFNIENGYFTPKNSVSPVLSARFQEAALLAVPEQQRTSLKLINRGFNVFQLVQNNGIPYYQDGRAMTFSSRDLMSISIGLPPKKSFFDNLFN